VRQAVAVLTLALALATGCEATAPARGGGDANTAAYDGRAEAARARAEARARAAQEACRARGGPLVQIGPNEWACGAEAQAAQGREEAAWRERCAAEGSEAYRVGRGLWLCARPTSDAGAACSAAGDCEGLCLPTAADARSGQCSATTRVAGCVTAIDANGRRGTVCAP
jgi:hypothetical protein